LIDGDAGYARVRRKRHDPGVKKRTRAIGSFQCRAMRAWSSVQRAAVQRPGMQKEACAMRKQGRRTVMRVHQAV